MVICPIIIIIIYLLYIWFRFWNKKWTLIADPSQRSLDYRSVIGNQGTSETECMNEWINEYESAISSALHGNGGGSAKINTWNNRIHSTTRIISASSRRVNVYIIVSILYRLNNLILAVRHCTVYTAQFHHIEQQYTRRCGVTYWFRDKFVSI